MYNSQNLPLSPRKIIKKTIAEMIRWVWVLIWVLIMLIPLLIGLSIFLVTSQPAMMLGLLIGPALIILLVIIVFIYEYLYYKLYYYNFEEEKGEIRKGVIARATGHIYYNRLQSIYVDQDILDRIFGLYDVHYETAGEISQFYSHVDGLTKENADKLTAFLIAKSKTRNFDPGTLVPNRDSELQPGLSSDKNSEATLSSEKCPLSPWIVFTGSIQIFLFCIIGLFIVFLIYPIVVAPRFFLVLFFFVFLFFIYSYVWYKNFYFYFGTEKGEIRTKVIGEKKSYVYYNRIQNINVSQGFVERLFGICTVIIETAGGLSGLSLRLPGLTQKNAEEIKNFLLTKTGKN
ncbi:MAG: PH domain-containing protein [Patescibacteria group bacterium]